MRARVFAAFMLVLAFAPACTTLGDVECMASTQCDLAVGGSCTPAPSGMRWCLYDDPGCASARRWSIFAGEGLAGQCVDTGLPIVDAGPDARVFTAPPVVTHQSADLVLGQPSFATTTVNTGGLSAQSMNLPLAVAGDDSRLWVFDGCNSRVLQWNGIPTVNGAAASLVLGQTSMTSATPGPSQVLMGNGACSFASGFGGLSVGGTWILASESLSNRVMVWSPPPVTASGQAATLVLGQSSFSTSSSGLSDSLVHQPVGAWTDGRRVAVADQVNARVLIWTDVAANGEAADLVLGQADFTTRTFLDPPDARSLWYVSDVHFDGTNFYASDETCNRVLVWRGFPTRSYQPADFVLGQSSFASCARDAGLGTVTGSGFYKPWSVHVANGGLFVSDRYNYRVLVWFPIPSSSVPATVVLGQPNLTTAGEPATPDAKSIRDPTGIGSAGNYVFVADTFWNRVLRFQMQN